MILTPLASFCLDIIRILAAQAVLIGHLIHSHELFLWLEPPTNPNMQNIAVVIFFLLSGFLIPMSVRAKRQAGNYQFNDYLRARFSRVYSLFLPALFLVVILDWLTIKFRPETYQYWATFNFKSFFTNLFMLQYFPSMPFGSGRPFWALPLWWWTYLSFGWLVLTKRRWPGIFFLAIPVYSVFFGRGQGLVLVWLMGAGIYYFIANKLLVRFNYRLALVLASAFIILAAIRVKQTVSAYELVFEWLIAGAAGFLLLGWQHFNLIIPARWVKTVKFLAGYSFALYLTHFSINSFILSFAGRKSWLPLFIFSWAVCNLAAMVMTVFAAKLPRRTTNG